MGAISYIPGADPAVIAAIVQAELAMNPPGSQTPRYSSAPATTVLGTKYYNTTDNKEYIYKSTGWVEMDVKDNEVQDIFGTVLMNE